MKALLIGSISVLVDTSEIQRCAFNDAFHEAGLDWYWSRDEYRQMLKDSGGKDRIEAFAERAGETVDAKALHAHKTEIFQQLLRAGGLELRVHTAQALADAREQGIKIAFVSGTAQESLDAVLEPFGGADALGLDLVTSAKEGLAAKPDPALYRYALEQLGVAASDAIAIEDNLAGVAAAKAAGITCYAYPNENTIDHDFDATPDVTELTRQQAA